MKRRQEVWREGEREEKSVSFTVGKLVHVDAGTGAVLVVVKMPENFSATISAHEIETKTEAGGGEEVSKSERGWGLSRGVGEKEFV